MSRRILVVDDEADVRTFIATVLKKGGHEAVTAENGAEALLAVRENKPDLVILDLQMPEKTGTEFYRQLSKDSALSDIPIIVVSGLAGRHLAIRKPVAVFDKPIDPEKFIEAVDKAIGD
ncbi:MAG: response regulator [Deltaproteobacteria bacterium]|nr:response regulator [Deltaproteobacteria bacterium]